MKFPAWYGILVGSLMIVEWTFSLYAGGVPELRTAPWEIAFHLAAEFSTAILLIVGGVAMLRFIPWSRTVLLLGLGMVMYSEIVSPGYFAQREQWPFMVMFAALLLGVVAYGAWGRQRWAIGTAFLLGLCWLWATVALRAQGSFGLAELTVWLAWSVIVLVALAIVRFARARSAAVRHWVLASAVACAAAVPFVSLAVPSWRLVARTSAPTAPAAVTVAYETVSAAASGTRAHSGSVVRVTMTDYLVPLWVGGVAVNLLILLAGICRLAWIVRRAQPVERGRWHESAVHTAREYGLARPPRVLQSDRPALLVTWGLIEPKVLLPAGAAGWSKRRCSGPRCGSPPRRPRCRGSGRRSGGCGTGTGASSRRRPAGPR